MAAQEGKTLGIYFEGKTLEGLDRLAKQMKRSRSNLVNILIQEKLEQVEGPAQPEDKPQPRHISSVWSEVR